MGESSFLFQALFVTVFQVLHGFFYSTIIDEPTQEIEEDVVPDDSMFASFTEKNFEDVSFLSF